MWPLQCGILRQSKAKQRLEQTLIKACQEASSDRYFEHLSNLANVTLKPSSRLTSVYQYYGKHWEKLFNNRLSSGTFGSRNAIFGDGWVAQKNILPHLPITFQGFALFLFVGLRAGKLVKKSATKPTDSSHYSSVALFLASRNFITFGNDPPPARPTKRNSAKPMLTADAAPRGTSCFSGKPAKPTPGENLSHAFGEI